MGDTAQIHRFSAAIERAYSVEAKPADNQADFDRWYPQFAKTEYDTAIQIINRVIEARLLNDLRDAYLKLYSRYAANRYNVHFARSDQTFFELFERAKKVSTKDRDLLGEWAAPLDDKKDTPLKKRFQELSPTYQSKVRALIPKPPPPVKTILDFLRDEYRKQHGHAAGSNADLYGLNPYQSELLKTGLQGHLDSLQRAWTACLAGNEDFPRAVFHGMLNAYQKYLATVTRQGLLQLFQVIKYLQDRIFVRRENMGTWTKISGGDTDPVIYELYAMACLQLLKYAQGELVLPSNRETFTKEEQQYFLRPLREAKFEYPYYSNIADRLSRPLGNVVAAFDLTKTFLDLILLTKVQIQGAILVPLGETHRIQTLWKPFRDLAEQIKDADAVEVVRLCTDPENVRIAQKMELLLALEVPLVGPNLDVAYARVGTSPGVHKTLGKVTIIHIDPKTLRSFYVEFEALKPNLFLVHEGYITSKVYGSRIYGVYESTIGTIYVVQGIFMMMGFVPAFIESGFAGLIYEIATWYVSSKVGEQVEEINPLFGKILGFALQIIAPRSRRYGTKLVEPPSVSRFERSPTELIELKGQRATEARGARQADSSWLDRNLANIIESQRAVNREPVSVKPAASPAEPKTVLAEPKPAASEPASVHAGRGEPARPGWKHQQFQQQQTRVKPPDAQSSAKSAKRAEPEQPRSGQEHQQPVGQRRKEPTAEDPTGRIATATDRPATGSLTVGDRSIGAAERTIDLSKPGAIGRLANAASGDVVAVLHDPHLFDMFRQSLRTTEAQATQAGREIAELGRVVGRFTNRTKDGIVHLDPAVSDAVWALPEHLRGVLIEHALANTQYRGWFRAGQLDRGFFPQIDYALQKGGMQAQASLKTVNPFAKGYETQLSETLPSHLEEIVTAVKNGRAGGFRVTVLLDVRFPQGSPVPRAQLQKTLDALIPSDVKRLVRVKVDEF